MTREYLGEVRELQPPERHLLPTGRYYVPGVSWHEIRQAFGPLQPHDVGKRVYRVNGVLQMENEQQRAERLAKDASQ